MEILLFLSVLIAVAVLATRFGYDSREPAYSKEAELASLGMMRDPTGTDTARDVAEPTAESLVPRNDSPQPVTLGASAFRSPTEGHAEALHRASKCTIGPADLLLDDLARDVSS